ncbi:hypothetical protein [Salibacterium qingdaonense]|uniref:Uncharacterized protein n=1 Tax=Salibacterium qingdaonense TaxID=266892 RepID=A0A1I4KQC0_9BACI|nr:hypothetical protein [Salibacterium qingdaonense]SFL80982.1 hypothetical protein SAMN04488054_105163 [Salibacterium qingdaonense]
MAEHPIKDPKAYNQQLREIETTDDVHPSVMNPLFYQLINNDAYLKEQLGDLANLSTEQKTNLVASINELLNKIGTLDNLNTDEKSDLVASINEVLQKFSTHSSEDVTNDNPPHGLKKNNYSATAEPTATDDSSAGYNVGSIWHMDDGSTKMTSYVCLDDTNGSAIWHEYAVDQSKYLDDTSGSPGSRTISDGDKDAGYYGAVPSSDFISGEQLASEVGLTAGTSQFSNTEWLKFSIAGAPAFSPQKPIRFDLSWDDLDNAGAVFGNKTVTINGLEYAVRLWRGAENDPCNYQDVDRDAIGSEWNKLMLPISDKAPDNFSYSEYASEPTENWSPNFTDEDLITVNEYGDGSRSWCQETISDDTGSRVGRGYEGVSYFQAYSSSGSNTSAGWRPVLELVQ